MHKYLSDAQNEIEATQIEAIKLVDALALAKLNPDMLTGTWGWITVQGFASAIEKIYSGCERTLDIIVKQIDQHPITRDESWHRQLFVRMSHSFEPIRPAVLSLETLGALNTLRSFRHRARNSYGSVLDYERVLEIAAEATLTPALLTSDLESLSDYLTASKN
jgi:hypothetical protein